MRKMMYGFQFYNLQRLGGPGPVRLGLFGSFIVYRSNEKKNAFYIFVKSKLFTNNIYFTLVHLFLYNIFFFTLNGSQFSFLTPLAKMCVELNMNSLNLSRIMLSFLYVCLTEQYAE